MRATCNEVLDNLKLTAPQKLSGYLYHNTVLGVLARRGFDEYTPVLGKVAKNIVHRVSLQSVTQDGHVVHTLVCQRTEDGGRFDTIDIALGYRFVNRSKDFVCPKHNVADGRRRYASG